MWTPCVHTLTPAQPAVVGMLRGDGDGDGDGDHYLAQGAASPDAASGATQEGLTTLRPGDMVSWATIPEPKIARGVSSCFLAHSRLTILRMLVTDQERTSMHIAARFSNLVRPLWADRKIYDNGWAVSSLNSSIQHAVLLLVAGWQLVMVCAAIISLGWSSLWVMILHVLIAGFALAVVRWPNKLAMYLLPALMAGIGLMDFLVVRDLDSVLAFAGCWQLNFASCVAGLLIRRKWVGFAVGLSTLVIGAAVLLLLPHWPTAFFVLFTVTQPSIIIALCLALPKLMSVAERADIESRKAEQETHKAELTHRISRQIAEEARLLHDAAINTLGAVANGGAAVTDPALVRAQCARDVELLERLRDKQREKVPIRVNLSEIYEIPALPIRRRGLKDSVLDEMSGKLDQKTANAVIGVVREAITNARKHSGADSVHVNTSVAKNNLFIEIIDKGKGFEGQVPDGRGLATSVFARARENSFSVDLQTKPGEGTVVKISVPLDLDDATRTVQHRPIHEVVPMLAKIYRQAGLLWAAGVTAVSVVMAISAVFTIETVLVPMIGVMILALLMVRFAFEFVRRTWVLVMLSGMTATIFWFSALSTDFGFTNAFHWHSLAPTAPFILLLSYQPKKRWIVFATGLWIIAAAISAGQAHSKSVDAMAIVMTAACVGLVVAMAWSRFMRAVSSISRNTAESMQRRFEARLLDDAEQAAQGTYRRWADAGLDDAIKLLKGISEGTVNHQAPSTIQQCDEEEGYLRQLVLISPSLIHMGQTMMPLLRRARDAEVNFTLRLGHDDATDRRTAENMAQLVRQVLSRSSAKSQVTASVFEVQNGIQLTLFGPKLGIESMTADDMDCVITQTPLGDNSLAQMIFPKGI